MPEVFSGRGVPFFALLDILPLFEVMLPATRSSADKTTGMVRLPA